MKYPFIIIFFIVITYYNSNAQRAYPIKRIGFELDTVESDSEMTYVQSKNILACKDSSIIIEYGHLIYLKNSIGKSRDYVIPIHVAKATFSISLHAFDSDQLYSLENFSVAPQTEKWNDSFVRVFFMDIELNRNVILMAEIHKNSLFNIGYESK